MLKTWLSTSVVQATVKLVKHVIVSTYGTVQEVAMIYPQPIVRVRVFKAFVWNRKFVNALRDFMATLATFVSKTSWPIHSRMSSYFPACSDSFYGQNCQYPCQCSKNSVCDVETGECTCYDGYEVVMRKDQTRPDRRTFWSDPPWTALVCDLRSSFLTTGLI